MPINNAWFYSLNVLNPQTKNEEDFLIRFYLEMVRIVSNDYFLLRLPVSVRDEKFKSFSMGGSETSFSLYSASHCFLFRKVESIENDLVFFQVKIGEKWVQVDDESSRALVCLTDLYRISISMARMEVSSKGVLVSPPSSNFH